MLSRPTPLAPTAPAPRAAVVEGTPVQAPGASSGLSPETAAELKTFLRDIKTPGRELPTRGDVDAAAERCIEATRQEGDRGVATTQAGFAHLGREITNDRRAALEKQLRELEEKKHELQRDEQLFAGLDAATSAAAGAEAAAQAARSEVAALSR